MDWNPVVKRLEREIENIETSIWGEGGVLVTKAADGEWDSTTVEWRSVKKEVEEVLDRYGNITYQVQEISNGPEKERQIVISTVARINGTDDRGNSE